MKNNLNDKQLNNLFEQIKKSEPLITRDESAQIIKNTNTFGVKTMIGIGTTIAAVAALITAGLFFPTEKDDIKDKTNINQKSQEQLETLPVNELEDQPRDENLSEKKVILESNDLALVEEKREEKREEVEKKDNNPKKTNTKQVQINAIQVNANAWKELGFVTSGNELKFSSFKDTPENTIVILGENNYDLKMSSDENIENKIFPAFVSNEKGERIISLFVNVDDGFRMTQLVKNNEFTERPTYQKTEYIDDYDSTKLTKIEKKIIANVSIDKMSKEDIARLVEERIESEIGDEKLVMVADLLGSEASNDGGHNIIIKQGQTVIVDDDEVKNNSIVKKVEFIDNDSQTKMTQTREYKFSPSDDSGRIEKIITSNIVQSYSDSSKMKIYPKVTVNSEEKLKEELVTTDSTNPLKVDYILLNIPDDWKPRENGDTSGNIVKHYIDTENFIFSDFDNPDSPKRIIVIRDESDENELLNINNKDYDEEKVTELFNNIRANNHFNNDKPIEMSRIAFDMLNEPTENKDDDEKYSSMISQQRVLVIEGDGSRTNDHVKVMMEAPVGTKFIVEYNPNNLSNVDRNKHSDRDILEMYLEKLKEIEFDRDIPIVMSRTAYTYLYNLQGEWKTQDSVHYNQKIIIKGEDGERVNGELSLKIPAVKETLTNYDYEYDYDSKKTGKLHFQTHDINKLIPMSVDLGEKKYILWFEPTDEFVRSIPRSLQETLRPEIEAIRKDETAQCGGTNFGEEAVMDLWKGCSGAIQNMKIYPNPAKINSNIEFTLDKDRTLDISIVDLSGRVIKQITSGEAVSSGQIERAINLDNISPGMYYVKITSEIGEQTLQRIIVN